MQSVCVFHNGNRRILDHYKQIFCDLKFVGNLAESTNLAEKNCLWEICFADVNVALLAQAKSQGVKILRHISTYQDDLIHCLPECQKFDYAAWLECAVFNNLCMADQVVSDWTFDRGKVDQTIILTTGRTANSHLQDAMKAVGSTYFECSKQYDQRFYSAAHALFLWRVDQYSCLTSTWIATQTDFKFAHQYQLQPSHLFGTVSPICYHWIKNNWLNHCKKILDQAMVSKYLIQRPTSRSTTEQVVQNLISSHKKLDYNKTELIPNYEEIERYYHDSDVAKILTDAYNNVCYHIPECTKIFSFN